MDEKEKQELKKDCLKNYRESIINLQKEIEYYEAVRKKALEQSHSCYEKLQHALTDTIMYLRDKKKDLADTYIDFAFDFIEPLPF